jgi:hypothetical protein
MMTLWFSESCLACARPLCFRMIDAVTKEFSLVRSDTSLGEER